MAGPSVRSTQNRWSSVHTEPSKRDRRDHGHGAGEREPAHGHGRHARRLPTMPAATMPIAKSAARSGADRITKTSRRGTSGPATPTADTTSVTPASMATAPRRRTASSSSGNTTYSWASTAIDQNDRSGLGAPNRFCTSRPLTTTDFTSGAPWPGGGAPSHATARLNARAA